MPSVNNTHRIKSILIWMAITVVALATGPFGAVVPSAGVVTGTRFGVEVTVMRNGVAYAQIQGWVFN